MSEAGASKGNDLHKRVKNILLDHYHCTFFLPLNGFSAADDEMAFNAKTYPFDRSVDEGSAQAFHYFTPTLRDILFESEDADQPLTPVREWVLPPSTFSAWLMELLPTEEQASSGLTHQKVMIQSVRLYRYFNGIYLLAFTVTPQILNDYKKTVKEKLDKLKKENEVASPENQKETWELEEAADAEIALFHSGKQFFDDYLVEGKLPEKFEGYQNLQLEAWLRFTRLARQLYPTFTEQGNEKKIAPLQLSGLDPKLVKQVTGQENGCIRALDQPMSCELPRQAAHLSPVILVLVQTFFKNSITERLKTTLNLYDDRMFVSVSYGLAGSCHDEDVLDYVCSLLATTDRVADGEYFPEFGHRPYSPEMYEGYMPKTLFNWWRAKGGYFIFNDMVNAYLYNGSFYRNVIAEKHIPSIYDRMMIQALFYQASLRHYDQEITRITGQLLHDKEINHILKQREEFIRFTNQYWFREVTSQMQGKEIFRLQQAGLGVEEHYQLLQDEISRTNDYLQASHENRIALWALVIGLIATLPVLNDIFKTEPSMWQNIIEFFGGCSANDSKVSGCSDILPRFILSCLVLTPVLLLLPVRRFLKNVFKRND